MLRVAMRSLQARTLIKSVIFVLLGYDNAKRNQSQRARYMSQSVRFRGIWRSWCDSG